MKKFLLLSFFLAAVAVYASEERKWAQIQIGQKTYKFEVASSPDERARGLMFRKHLHRGSGMLFIFESPGVLKFHMKNTPLPLDIVFIDECGLVIDLKAMKPLDSTVVSSSREALYALEANRGFFKKAGLKAGDKIGIDFIESLP